MVESELQRETTERIVAFFKSDIINDDTVALAPGDEIISNGLIDSMGIVRLVTHLQGVYRIKKFERHDMVLDNFRTIERIAALVVKYRRSAAHAG